MQLLLIIDTNKSIFKFIITEQYSYTLYKKLKIIVTGSFYDDFRFWSFLYTLYTNIHTCNNYSKIF